MSEAIKLSPYFYTIDSVIAKYFKHFNNWQLCSSSENIQDYYIHKLAKDKLENEKFVNPFLCFPREVWDTEKISLGFRQSLMFPSYSVWSRFNARDYAKYLQSLDDKVLTIFSKSDSNSKVLPVLCNENGYTNIGENVVHIAWRPCLSSNSQILACLVTFEAKGLSKINELNILQIWDYGMLSNISVKPMLKYSLILDWGKIIKMLWISPDKVNNDIVKSSDYKGSQFEPPQELYGHMLFLCADGKLKIIPIAEFSDFDMNSFEFIELDPKQLFVLQINSSNVMELGISTSYLNDTKARFGYPTCVDWKSKFPTKLLVGFSKGFVAIFDLSLAHHTRYDYMHHYLSPTYKKRFSFSSVISVAFSPIDWQQFNVTVAPNPEGSTNFNVNIASNFRPIDVLMSNKPLWTVIWPSRADLLIGVPITRNKVIIKSILSQDTAIVQVNKITSICVCDFLNSVIVTTECGSILSISLNDPSIVRSLIEPNDSIDLSELPIHIRSYRYCIDKNKKNKYKKSFIDITSQADVVSLYDSYEKVEYPQINSISINPNMISLGWVAIGFENGLIHTARFSNTDTMPLIKSIIVSYEESKEVLSAPSLKTKKGSNVRKVNKVPSSDKKKSKVKTDIKIRQSPDYDPLDNILYSNQFRSPYSSSKDPTSKKKKNQVSKEKTIKTKKKSNKSSSKIIDSDSDEFVIHDSSAPDFVNYTDQMYFNLNEGHVDKDLMNLESGNSSSTENMIEENNFFVDSESYNDNSNPKISTCLRNDGESSYGSTSIKDTKNQSDLCQNLSSSTYEILKSTENDFSENSQYEYSNVNMSEKEDSDFAIKINSNSPMKTSENSSSIIDSSQCSKILTEQTFDSSNSCKSSFMIVNIDSHSSKSTIFNKRELLHENTIDDCETEKPVDLISNSELSQDVLVTSNEVIIDQLVEHPKENSQVEIKSELITCEGIIENSEAIHDENKITVVEELSVLNEINFSNVEKIQSSETEKSIVISNIQNDIELIPQSNLVDSVTVPLDLNFQNEKINSKRCIENFVLIAENNSLPTSDLIDHSTSIIINDEIPIEDSIKEKSLDFFSGNEVKIVNEILNIYSKEMETDLKFIKTEIGENINNESISSKVSDIKMSLLKNAKDKIQIIFDESDLNVDYETDSVDINECFTTTSNLETENSLSNEENNTKSIFPDNNLEPPIIMDSENVLYQYKLTLQHESINLGKERDIIDSVTDNIEMTTQCKNNMTTLSVSPEILYEKIKFNYSNKSKEIYKLTNQNYSNKEQRNISNESEFIPKTELIKENSSIEIESPVKIEEISESVEITRKVVTENFKTGIDSMIDKMNAIETIPLTNFDIRMINKINESQTEMLLIALHKDNSESNPSHNLETLELKSDLQNLGVAGNSTQNQNQINYEFPIVASNDLPICNVLHDQNKVFNENHVSLINIEDSTKCIHLESELNQLTNVPTNIEYQIIPQISEKSSTSISNNCEELLTIIDSKTNDKNIELNILNSSSVSVSENLYNFQEILKSPPILSQPDNNDSFIDLDEIISKPKSSGNIFQIISEFQTQNLIPVTKTNCESSNLEGKCSDKVLVNSPMKEEEKCLEDFEKVNIDGYKENDKNSVENLTDNLVGIDSCDVTDSSINTTNITCHNISIRETKQVKYISDIEKSDIYENVGLVNIEKSIQDNKIKIDKEVIQCSNNEIKMESIEDIEKKSSNYSEEKDRNSVDDSLNKINENLSITSNKLQKNIDHDENSSKKQTSKHISKKENKKQIPETQIEDNTKKKYIGEISLKFNPKKEIKMSMDKNIFRKRKLVDSSLDIKLKKLKCNNSDLTPVIMEQISTQENISKKPTNNMRHSANIVEKRKACLINQTPKLKTINEYKNESAKSQNMELDQESSIKPNPMRKLLNSVDIERENPKKIKLDELVDKEINKIKSTRFSRQEDIIDSKNKQKQKHDSDNSVSNSINSSDDSNNRKNISSSKISKKAKLENWWNKSIITIDWLDEKYKGKQQRIKGKLLNSEPIIGKENLVHWPRFISKMYPAIVREIFSTE